MIVQYCFRCRTHLEDRSSHCLVYFSKQTTPNQIGPNSLVLISAYTRPIRLITLLSYPIFIIDHTGFDRSQQLSFVFSVDHIYTISHLVVLSGFRHSQHPIRSVTSVLYHFRCRWSVKSLSCLVFTTNWTRFNQSQQLNFDFSVDRIYRISNIVVLYVFHHS